MSGIRVVKLGGRTQSDPRLAAVIADLWRTAPHSLVIVHGGGDQISALQRLRGEEPVFVGGRRVTTPLALELVRMSLSGLSNKQLVSALNAAGARAVGISGEDDAMLRATPIDPGRFGLSGTPAGVNPDLIHALLANRFLPVISPVAASQAESGEIGGALNVNGDDAAAAIAASLQAAELFLMADVAGVLDEQRNLIPELSLTAAAALVESGVAGGGMAAKLDACAQALAGGVTRVRIGDVDALGRNDAGTAIVQEQHEHHALPRVQ